MAELSLVIGNKNYSSSSLSPWILMKQLGLKFKEIQLQLYTPTFKDEIASFGPSGRVPVLLHGELAIWDSLAICEYIAELCGRGWPQERAARAMGRSVCAEVHSGFINLRTEWPMNARARNRRTPMTPGLEADIDRIEEIWNDCRRRFGSKAGGPWLFGEYTIADAMCASIVLKFNTYAAHVSDSSRWYMAASLESPALQEWVRAAQNEPWINEDYEVG